MKKILLLLLIISFGALASNDTLKIKDSTILEIKDGKEIFQTKTDLIDKYMGGIIALITIIGSAIMSYKIARHQTKKQEEINEKQIQTQIEIARQQLELNNRQLEEQSRIAIESVRANNISEARINWIQELRPILGKLIQNADDFAYQMSTLKPFIDPETKKVQKGMTKQKSELYNKQREKTQQVISDFESNLKQVKLFLNKDEKEHKAFLDTTDNFIEQAFKNVNEESIEDHIDENNLIQEAQIILKNAWEQAKNEGN